MVELKISISYSKWFKDKNELAEFFNLKHFNRKSILNKCNKMGYEIDYNE